MKKLLVATRNRGKVAELLSLLDDLPFELLTLDDFENVTDVEETGSTFIENAKLKSLEYAKQTNCLTLADDSGLEVEALDGAPGVYSARYSGENASDKDNIDKLLRELNAKKDQSRLARFVCAMSISDPSQNLFYGEGYCPGKIALSPIGSGGFGYDPVFVPAGYQRTFGELSAKTKKKVSHRSIALKKIIRFLSEIASY
ncbi:MAG: XTP/dITP diphosphatase [Pyrinomonadaceae bacterium]|nr:XTP/dITP diphosphatase [Pyrinomonadaceae bacterium]